MSDGGFQDDLMRALIFYIVVDNSYSMAGDPIASANMMLPQVLDALKDDPMVSDLVHVGILSFSDTAKTVVPVSDPRNIGSLPSISVEGGTSYKALFDLLYSVIPTDVAQLKQDGFKVHRPAVFFITDGAPTDDVGSLQASWQQLTSTDFKARPNMIPFGVGMATKDLLDPYVTGRMRSFVAAPGVDPAHAISKIAEVLLGSIIGSAQSAAVGDAGFILPEDEDGDWL